MLTLVGTPIGNLGDISPRALEALGKSDWVISEDTRKTGFLLHHFGLKKPQLSFREDNEERALGRVMDLLREGKQVALVTDAGMPGISDPGFTLVRACLQEGVEVGCVPGPTAFVMALVLSGLPLHSFTFRGFPPHKGGPRRRFLEMDRDSPYTLVYYESPYRLHAFLQDALAVFGERPACIANDLTKMFELVERDSLSKLAKKISHDKLRGEYTVVIGGKPQD